MKRLLLACSMVAATLGVALSASAGDEADATPSQKDILDAAPDSAWRHPDPHDTLYMQLAGGQRVIIELAPAWAPRHAANIKTLVHAAYFDDTSVYRVQDNFVAQWGDPDVDDDDAAKSMGKAERTLPPEFTRTLADVEQRTSLPDGDTYAPHVGFSRGLPIAWDADEGKAWPVQCYGMVGVARGADPRSGNGNTLYVPIGQAPRQLDRQLAVVGRVLKGMQWLASLPRGPEPLGVYSDPDKRTPIQSVRLATELPADERVDIKVLRTDSDTFARLVEAKRNRHDDFYQRPPGAIGICNVPLPVRVLG